MSAHPSFESYPLSFWLTSLTLNSVSFARKASWLKIHFPSPLPLLRRLCDNCSGWARGYEAARADDGQVPGWRVGTTPERDHPPLGNVFLWWVTGGDTSCALRSFDHHLRQSEPPTNSATPTSHILFSSPMNCCNLCKRLFQQIEMLNAKAIECGPAWYSLNYKQPLGFSNLFKHDKIENWRGLNLFKCRPRE